MTDINTSYKNADVFGRAAFEELDNYIMTVLLSGAEPSLAPPLGLLLADDQDLAQFTVVGLNGNGKLVQAMSSVKPIGILAHAAKSGSGNTTARGQVWYQGCFNRDGPLVWHADFSTDALKEAAFINSPAPCQIIIRPRGITA